MTRIESEVTAVESIPAADVQKEFDLGKAVGKVAALVASDRLSTGDLAELRRISPDAPFTPALWKVLFAISLQNSPIWRERQWATLLMGMAHCSGLHDYGVPLGRALAEAGWSELRLVQLLRSSGLALDLQIRRVSQYLASKSKSANWAEVARLLMNQSGDAGDRIRLQIARSYYTTLYAQESR